MPPASDPVLLYVSTAEALAAWSLVDLRLVCASCAVDLRLVCAWSAPRAPKACFFCMQALLALFEIYLRIAMDLCSLAFLK